MRTSESAFPFNSEFTTTLHIPLVRPSACFRESTAMRTTLSIG